MDCPRCKLLDLEFVRLDRIHAETMEKLQAHDHTKARWDELKRLQIIESDARLDLELARADLARHKRDHQSMN